MAAKDFDVDFLEGFARLLAATAALEATWKTDGAYAASDTAIVLGDLPESPNRVIALASYGVDDDPSLSDSVIGLQVATRWESQDPRATGRLTAGVFDTLHGLHDLDLPTEVHVVQCLRRSWTGLGQDANHRYRTVQNFYVTVHRPSTNRT